MKTYQKPELTVQRLEFNTKLASISDWLANGGQEFENAGIVTHLVNSY